MLFIASASTPVDILEIGGHAYGYEGQFRRIVVFVELKDIPVSDKQPLVPVIDNVDHSRKSIGCGIPVCYHPLPEHLMAFLYSREERFEDPPVAARIDEDEGLAGSLIGLEFGGDQPVESRAGCLGVSAQNDAGRFRSIQQCRNVDAPRPVPSAKLVFDDLLYTR